MVKRETLYHDGMAVEKSGGYIRAPVRPTPRQGEAGPRGGIETHRVLEIGVGVPAEQSLNGRRFIVSSRIVKRSPTQLARDSHHSLRREE